MTFEDWWHSPMTSSMGGFTYAELYRDAPECKTLAEAGWIANGGVEGSEPSFGIIDPDYARIFTKARILAWSYGYACVAHGSFTRDLDLLLVPWTEQATPDSAKRIIRMLVESCDLRMDDKPADKPHGRRAYSLHLKGFGEPRWVDLSVLTVAEPVALLKRIVEASGDGDSATYLDPFQIRDALKIIGSLPEAAASQPPGGGEA